MFRSRMARGACLAALTAAMACGGKDNITGPSTTTTTATSSGNRTPTVNSMTVNPTFGIASLTTFALSASASDPDNDPVTLTWAFGDGTTGTGSAFSKIYQGSGAATVTVTASDGRGGTVSDSRTLTVGSLTGGWSGQWSSYQFTMNLSQSGGFVSGTYNDRDGAGRTDPAQPGTISSGGAVVLRMKQGAFGDFTFTGQMDSTGRRVSGTVAGSGVSGTATFVMDKQ